MPRLYSDLVDSQGRRYYFNLESAPGGIAPGAGQLNIQGFAPTVLPLVEAFRTPAPGLLILQGQTIVNPARVSPLPGLLTRTGNAPTLVTQRVVTNSLPPPDYNPPQGLAPTILFIQTITPGVGLLTFQNSQINASPGGDIGYVTPIPGLLSLVPLTPSLIFLEAGVGQLNIQGCVPTIISSRSVTPEPGMLVLSGLDPTLDQPFEWIDVEPPPSTTWTDVKL